VKEPNFTTIDYIMSSNHDQDDATSILRSNEQREEEEEMRYGECSRGSLIDDTTVRSSSSSDDDDEYCFHNRSDLHSGLFYLTQTDTTIPTKIVFHCDLSDDYCLDKDFDYEKVDEQYGNVADGNDVDDDSYENSSDFVWDHDYDLYWNDKYYIDEHGDRRKIAEKEAAIVKSGKLAGALLHLLKEDQNYTLERFELDHGSIPLRKDIDFYLQLNKEYQRKLLLSGCATEDDWMHTICSEAAANHKDPLVGMGAVYYFLRQNPSLLSSAAIRRSPPPSVVVVPTATKRDSFLAALSQEPASKKPRGSKRKTIPYSESFGIERRPKRTCRGRK
jgi:hypothetical protein